VEFETVSLRNSPEQNEHEHDGLMWDWKEDLFICMGTPQNPGCGAKLCIPELSEAMLLSVQSE